jgi:hypothetical protein
MNKQSEYQAVYSCLSLNNHSFCGNGHVDLTFCRFPRAMRSEESFSFSIRRKFIQLKFTEDLQHNIALKLTYLLN